MIFDETLFPFEHLHPNAGSRLRNEIILLPDHLANPGDVSSADHTLANPNPSARNDCVQE